jgi:hypothetical protein
VCCLIGQVQAAAVKHPVSPEIARGLCGRGSKKYSLGDSSVNFSTNLCEADTNPIQLSTGSVSGNTGAFKRLLVPQRRPRRPPWTERDRQRHPSSRALPSCSQSQVKLKYDISLGRYTRRSGRTGDSCVDNVCRAARRLSRDVIHHMVTRLAKQMLLRTRGIPMEIWKF